MQWLYSSVPDMVLCVLLTHSSIIDRLFIVLNRPLCMYKSVHVYTHTLCVYVLSFYIYV